MEHSVEHNPHVMLSRRTIAFSIIAIPIQNEKYAMHWKDFPLIKIFSLTV